MNDAEVYLDTLFDGLEGLVYSPIKTLEGDWNQHWFEYPQQRDSIVEHLTKAPTGDVYLSPVLYKERKATKDSVKKAQVVWVEFDGKDQINFKGVDEPTLIVQTSSTSHVHCYWRIPASNPVPVEETNRRLTYYLDADTSGYDITQLLRPPLTLNHKYGTPIEVALKHQSRISYTLGSFDEVPTVSTVPSAVVTTENVLLPGKVFGDHELAIKLVKMVKSEIVKEPYRSSFLFRLANELAEEELSHLEIVSLLKVADDRIGKFSGRTDQLVRLSQLADHALHKVVAANEVVVWTFDEILSHHDTLNWIYPGLLHTTGQLILSSAPGVGKTQLIAQMSSCLQTQTRFLGYKADAIYKCLIFSLEMDRISFKYILEHQKKEWSSEGSTVGFIDEEGSLTQYENIIAKLQPNVIFIDSLTELHDDTNDNTRAEARRVMRWCRKIRRRYGCAMVIIHHNRKATEGNKKPKGLADLEGSFQFAKDSETVVQLWEDHKGIEFGVVKARFGKKEAFMVERNQNLWFTRKDYASQDREPTANPERNQSKPGNSTGHGNTVHGFGQRTTSFGFGGKNSS